jgi:hypothetical protein
MPFSFGLGIKDISGARRFRETGTPTNLSICITFKTKDASHPGDKILPSESQKKD